MRPAARQSPRIRGRLARKAAAAGDFEKPVGGLGRRRRTGAGGEFPDPEAADPDAARAGNPFPGQGSSRNQLDRHQDGGPRR